METMRSRIALFPARERGRDALVERGYVVTELEHAQVLVLDAARPPSLPAGLPIVLIAEGEHTDDTQVLPIETEVSADAFLRRRRSTGEEETFRRPDLFAAIEWARQEDRSMRKEGAVRLVWLGGHAHAGTFGGVFPLALEGTTDIGRSLGFVDQEGCISVPMGTVARAHARFHLTGGNLTLTDLASTNGTLLLRGGQPPLPLLPSAPVRVQRDDHVVIAGFACRFRVDGLLGI